MRLCVHRSPISELIKQTTKNKSFYDWVEWFTPILAILFSAGESTCFGSFGGFLFATIAATIQTGVRNGQSDVNDANDKQIIAKYEWCTHVWTRIWKYTVLVGLVICVIVEFVALPHLEHTLFKPNIMSNLHTCTYSDVEIFNFIFTFLYHWYSI